MRVGIIASGREEGLVESLIRAGIRSGFGDDGLRIIGVEWCPDCSTSGRTAAYYDPYVGEKALGEPEPNTGMLLYDLEDLKARAVAAHRAGLMVCIEGVGDRGIDFALDAIEAALAADPRSDHRMRVEHCCYVTPTIVERLKRLGVTDSSATGFMYELGDAYRANRGATAMAWMWPHRTLIDEGIPAPGHSDAYVCTPDPFAAMWALVNRRSDSGGVLDAPGSLEVGKLADLAVLDRDILSIPPEEIRQVRVDMTFLGGALVFQRT
jgi:predicted amidohydrolase YtcJ